MTRAALAALAAVTLCLAACGGGGNEVASRDAAPAATAAPTETATPSPAPTPETTPEPGTCDEVEFTPRESTEFTHPALNFFEPGATNLPSEADLDHLLVADNAVVVTYAASTPKKTRDRLYDWTYEDVVERTPVVVPDSSEDALPVRARIATIELRCNGFDWKRLTAFANRTDVAPLPRTG